MGMLDSFRKSKEEKKEHTTPPPQGHTLAEVLHDKNKLDLFGKLLTESGDEDLADRIAQGKLDEGDVVLLEEKRKIFSEKITASEKVEKLLTKENIIDIARNHPDFEKILNLVGPEKAVKVIQNRLKEISITDVGTFNIIASAMQASESHKNGPYKALNDEVEKFCKENNIAPKEYLDALAIEDTTKKEEALKELASKIPSKLRNFGNWISGGIMGKGGSLNKGTLQDLKKYETSFIDSTKELDTLQGEIGNVLFASVSGNESMRNYLFSELRGETDPREPKMSFKDVKNGNIDEAKLDKDWEARKKKERYNTQIPAQKDVIKKAFMDEQREAYKKTKGSGLWYDIVMAFNEAFINDKEAELK